MMSSSSSCSSILVLQIPTRMDSHSVVMQKMFLKPLNLNFGRDRGIQQQLVKLNHHHRVLPLRCCSTSTTSSGDHLHNNDADVVLHVQGMMCEGCASSVKKLLETQPQVLSANVNLASEIALVSLSPLLSQEKTATDWQKQLGEKLAHHLTTCGFTSTLRGQEDSA